MRFDHGFLRPNLQRNVDRTCGRRCGHHDVHTELARRAPADAQSFLDKGDFAGTATPIFSYPMWIALEQIPLVFWGEPSTEYVLFV